MEPIWIAGIVLVVVILISTVGYLGPGAFLIYWIILKTVLGYGWKFLAPIWVILKSKAGYKLIAIGLTFASFLLYFYSFLKSGDTSLLTAALDALAATIVGSLEEIKTSATVLLGSVGVWQKLFSLVVLVMGVAKLYLYFVGWNMMKKRIPEFTFYTLVVFSFLLLTWGSQDPDALFEVFDVAQSAADQAASGTGQQMLSGSPSSIASSSGP